MSIENQVFFVPLLTGSIFLIAGLILFKFTPKKINWFYGYRTISSMKNQERWDFAQTYSAKEMIRLGGLLLLSSTVGLIYKPEEIISTFIGIGLLMIVVVVLIVRVEKAIKNRFGKTV